MSTRTLDARKPLHAPHNPPGDYANKIFSLAPTACVYPASGINANLQWCGVGFAELPNGLGFGGQVGHFGLFVDASLDSGHSRPNATYASPCLSSDQLFEVDTIEAWLLKPLDEEDQEERSRGRRGGGAAAVGASILHKVGGCARVGCLGIWRVQSVLRNLTTNQPAASND
jgi:hypothetical protein